MTLNDTVGRRIRLQHLYRHDPSSLFVVPLDHSVTSGPITRDGQLNRLVGRLAGNGVDAVVLHKGAPLLAMLYPRGPKVADGRRPDLVAHAAVLAAELGADLVKCALPKAVSGI